MADDKENEPEKPARDPAKEMDDAVKKAEDAARRLHRAEDVPLESFGGGEEAVFPDEDEPGAAAGEPG